MANRQEPATYAWFAVSRLLEEIAKESRAGHSAGEHVELAAMEIARHIADHGPLIAPATDDA